MTDTAPDTGIYRDLLDPHCNALNISATDATTYYDETVPVVQLSITSDVACDEDDNIVYIRLEDVDSVIGMIRSAAEEATQPTIPAACECAQLAEKYRPCSACNPYTPPTDPVLAGADWLEGIGQDHAASMLRAWHNGDFAPAAKEAGK